METVDLKAFYRSYLQCCNDHRFDALDEFVAEEVEVNGTVQSRLEYAAGLRTVIDTFPDFHWDLRHLLADQQWLGAHLVDTYTTPTGHPASTQELAIYNIVNGQIVAVWGDLDHNRLT